MNKGDQGKTVSGHLVLFEYLIEQPNYSHPLVGWINYRFHGVEWTKQVWTIMGKVNHDGTPHELDLDWNYYVTVK